MLIIEHRIDHQAPFFATIFLPILSIVRGVFEGVVGVCSVRISSVIDNKGIVALAFRLTLRLLALTICINCAIPTTSLNHYL